MPYLSALEVCSRRGAIQIHVYLYLYSQTYYHVSTGEIRSTHITGLIWSAEEQQRNSKLTDTAWKTSVSRHCRDNAGKNKLSDVPWYWRVNYLTHHHHHHLCLIKQKLSKHNLYHVKNKEKIEEKKN